MNCVNHPETTAVAFCRSCGKALCASCQMPMQGTVYCAEHAPAVQSGAPPQQNPYTAPAAPPSVNTGVSPGVAFLLGLIPGVGAIYNGQYAKGLIHVVIFGLLISIVSSGTTNGLEPMFGMLIPVFVFYMAFEAYHTAMKRQMGVPVDEFSSIVTLRHGKGFPLGPIILIAAGVLFLLINLEAIRLYQVVRYWPVFLIVLGVYMLYSRITQDSGTARTQEPSHER